MRLDGWWLGIAASARSMVAGSGNARTSTTLFADEGWGRIDVVEADISFDQPGEPKTGRRTVPIPPVLVTMLRKWIDETASPRTS